MKLTGIKDLLKFIQHLNDISGAAWYRLSHDRYDAVMVSIDMVGVRLELEFFEDHIEYSVFEGDESVHDDQERLFALLETNRD
ncbi:hypothetical protein [Bauldia sp.]|uniref:hypothetical protein n=1 Tax=Bauldia sp. TaxID=2575872 RepID=UPI003BABCCA0